MSCKHAVICKVDVPKFSGIKAALTRTDFVDAYEVQLGRPQLQVADVYVAIFCDPPLWVQWLMDLRGYIAVCLGLTHPFDQPDVSSGDDLNFKVGTRAGPFTVQSISANELIVGDDDKHLNFRISCLKFERNGSAFITISTAVEIHNALGQFYMFVVKPFHRFIAPFMVRQAVRAGKL